MQVSLHNCMKNCDIYVKELEKGVQQTKQAMSGQMNEINKLLGQLFGYEIRFVVLFNFIILVFNWGRANLCRMYAAD